MTALTHTIAPTGRCSACDITLVEHMAGAEAVVYPGDRIGKIETEHGGVRSYRVGERDSNQPCS